MTAISRDAFQGKPADFKSMKPSGVSWLGEIPAGWDIIAFWQAILRMGTGLNPRENFKLTKEDPLYYVTIRNFKDGRLYLDDNCDRISQEAWDIIQKRSDLQIGDILFASISKDGQAYILVSEPINWNINESVFCIRTNPGIYDPKYFYYHLINKGYYDDLLMDASGSTFQSIKQHKLRKSRLVLPPLPTQRRIAAFLDTECARIDTIIEKTRASIEEYKKLKQTVITETVTKGIRKGRPMQESGVEWIGEIPAEWKVVPLKRIAKIQTGNTPSKTGNDKYYSRDSGYLWVKAENLGSMRPIDKTAEYLTEEGIRYGRLFPPNTVFVCCIASIGKVGFCNVAASCNQQINGLIFHHAYWKYGFYVSLAQESEYLVNASGNVVKILNSDKQSGLMCPLPPAEEQREIADYLDKKCVETDAIIAKKEQLIAELETYKKSLIYETVTGKKEVPA